MNILSKSLFHRILNSLTINIPRKFSIFIEQPIFQESSLNHWATNIPRKFFEIIVATYQRSRPQVQTHTCTHTPSWFEWCNLQKFRFICKFMVMSLGAQVHWVGRLKECILNSPCWNDADNTLTRWVYRCERTLVCVCRWKVDVDRWHSPAIPQNRRTTHYSSSVEHDLSLASAAHAISPSSWTRFVSSTWWMTTSCRTARNV